MSEQGAEFTSTETEDVEGHRNLRAGIDGPDEDVEGHVGQRPPLVDGAAEEDVEGHVGQRPPLVDGAAEEDVEGHVEPPRGDDTDHLHS